jgi:hypothetical protein
MRCYRKQHESGAADALTLGVEQPPFVEVLIWRLAQPLSGSAHRYKDRLADIVDNACVLRDDNETGKGDHKHLEEVEVPYQFTDLDTLQADSWADVHAG